MSFTPSKAAARSPPPAMDTSSDASLDRSASPPPSRPRFLLAPPQPHFRSMSAPCKRVRALRLFDDPDDPQVPPAPPLSPDRPTANVNPFSPRPEIGRKRPRSLNGSYTDVDEDADSAVERPLKKLVLSDSSVSRYRKEFVELEELGNGEFGSVHKCLNRLNGRVYAIKKSLRPVAGTALERMSLNEVYAHSVLDRHQNVVRFYSAWTEDGHMYIQNEYCDGGSLEARLAADGPLPAPELLRLLAHCCRGLRYIHSEGLVHLDVKPGNVFVARERHPDHDSSFEEEAGGGGAAHDEEETVYKLGDLGHVTSIARPQVEEGDCRYLATEVLREDFSHLPKADVFSVALTVLEAAGGGPLPKNGAAWHRLRDPLRHPLPATRTPLPPDLADLLRDMLRPDAAERPAAAQALQHRALDCAGLGAGGGGGGGGGDAAKKSKAQLHRELNASRLQAEILRTKLVEAGKCIKSLTSRAVVTKKFTRSMSTGDF